MESRKWNGYFTIEASFVVPIVLFLYLSVVSVTLLLYDRCLVSQDCFLLGMRAAAFTRVGENYGEVIYGDEWRTDFSKRDYITERWEKRKGYYIGKEWKESIRITENDGIEISVCGKTNANSIDKSIQILNPVTRIREGRKYRHASGKVL